jgi:hypothetical protein
VRAPSSVIVETRDILRMYEQARETLNSCMSKYGQDGWLSLRSDCGQMLLHLSLATLDTVTMVQVWLLPVQSILAVLQMCDVAAGVAASPAS